MLRLQRGARASESAMAQGMRRRRGALLASSAWNSLGSLDSAFQATPQPVSTLAAVGYLGRCPAAAHA